jgi:TPR repeat protein
MDRWTLNAPPPAAQLAARLAWAGREADRLRDAVRRSPREPRTTVLLSALAVVVASDLEHAISLGDSGIAKGLGDLLEKKLADTPVRLGPIARHGAGGGHFALGILALHGLLVERDRANACSRMESAWADGFRPSAYRLYECVADRDPPRAAALLQAAADTGHATAAEVLGRRCLEARPQDARCAARYIVAAATEGRPSAKSLLAWMYTQGAGVPTDPARALALYLDAAGAGDLSAKNNLGELHETGRGVPADAGKAAAYYQEAARAGFAPSQFNLGRMYAAGAGVPKDYAMARTLLGSALRAGVEPARKVLDWLDAQEAGQARPSPSRP